jgi:flagellar basal body rod protein FlgG
MSIGGQGPIGTVMGAMRYWERRQESMSHNLANASTDGYKAERVFARLGEEGLEAVSRTDFGSGPVTVTGRPLDVALEGEGYLVVQTERGERWSRGGALAVDATGALVDAAGNQVLGEGGPIVLPPGTVEIATNGAIDVDGIQVGRLRIERAVEVGAAASAESIDPGREGGVYFRPTDGAEPVLEDRVTVRQGHIEEANLDPVGSMVEMMEIQRAYAALQRSATVVDGLMDTAANRLGRVG